MVKSLEFEPCTAEDPPCRGGDARLIYRRPPVGVVWKLGGGVPAQVSSSSLDHGLNYEVRHQRKAQLCRAQMSSSPLDHGSKLQGCRQKPSSS
ncbi:hypothetical protein TNCV_4770751 [Trichonephila clavipes]|nr:hypothetical protein TNCV_4770751 [Trichonephila clavipes]